MKGRWTVYPIRINGLSVVMMLILLCLSVFGLLSQETEDSVTKIAYQSGFEDSNYFSRTFHKFIGMTPREYRSRIKSSQSELPAEDRKKRAQEQAAP